MPWSCRALAVLALVLAANPRATAIPPPAPIEIEVDATDVTRNLLHARLLLPVKPGPLTLYYPKWIPGTHSPSGPIADLTGLKMRAAGKPLDWRRDEADPYTLHCQVPPGASKLEVTLDLLGGGGHRNTKVGSPYTGVVNWNLVLLYPRSDAAMKLMYQPSLRLPEGWEFGTALKPLTNKDLVRFEPVSLETLVDSPVLMGAYLRKIPLGPEKDRPHQLILACDSKAGLELTPQQKIAYDRLILEAHSLFGCRHYNSYTFLLALSDQLGTGGLEHHECSDNRLPERALIDPALFRLAAGLLPHEYVHSWNGKYRRPADMITSDFQQPEHTRLLWVYEGLTHYLMVVLTARSGLWTPEETRDFLADIAEEMNNQRGRTWRPLEDTAVSSSLLMGSGRSWTSWRRSADFYDESVLLWLEVDTLIRQETRGKKSLDDFCRRFLGGKSGPPEVKPYTFDELVADLNAVAPYDWKGLLTRRVAAVSEKAPLEGIVRSGWKLTYTDKPSTMQKGRMTRARQIDLTSSVGLRLSNDGAILDVIAGSAADRAGVGAGMKVVAVNARRFSPERLETAVKATARGGELELLLEHGDFFRTHRLSYHGGLRYPHLERLEDRKVDLLADILKPLVEMTRE
jgi:predicted metalloprotease with PDZ domain